MKKHALIIEDDRWLADMLADMLRRDFEVAISHDAQTAIEAIDARRPDIILLDIMLPGGNGLAFLQELRSYDDLAEVPVLVCSSVSLKHEQLQALRRFDGVAYLDKAHLTPETLKAKIAALEVFPRCHLGKRARES